MQTILFLCTGNTCRSPMAEYLCRELLSRRGVGAKFEIKSAGLAAMSGDPISENARLALLERGIDAANHRARPVSFPLLQNADYIYPMTPAHKAAIISVLPELEKKITVLDIPDPFGQDLSVYRACLDAIEARLDTIIPDWMTNDDET